MGYDGALVLEDGSVVPGSCFGSKGVGTGELVFTTSPVGYVESLTDPSYRGQIIVFSNPLMGCYGAPGGRVLDEYGLPMQQESFGVQVSGVVVSRHVRHSHWSAGNSLGGWLKKNGVVALEGVDTRMLIRRIRERGVVKASVACAGCYEESVEEGFKSLEKSRGYEELSFYEVATFRRVTWFKGSRGRLLLIDNGVKLGVVRRLLELGYELVVVPHYLFKERLLDDLGVDGVVLCNGPGDPRRKTWLVRAAKALLESGKPLLGICLGHQLVALALGCRVYKLPFGHRSSNKPVLDVETGRCYITTHNHGYAVDPRPGGDGVRVWAYSVDDSVVEGIKLDKPPVLTCQFHPEGGPGPRDSGPAVFNRFDKLCRA